MKICFLLPLIVSTVMCSLVRVHFWMVLFRALAAADDIVRDCGQFTDAERSIVLNVRIKHLAIMIAFYAWYVQVHLFLIN